MRYTTIIDITELRLYRNITARLVYLHLCLTAGYHDEDRDIVTDSLRGMAKEIGVTVSALRHALNILMKAGLLTRQDGTLKVTKWLTTAPITARPKTKAAEKKAEARQREDEERQERDARRKEYDAKTAALEAEGKDNYMLYVEELRRKAAAGDVEAAALAERHARGYEQHAKMIAARKPKESQKKEASTASEEEAIKEFRRRMYGT